MTGNKTMEFFTTSKVFCATTVLLLGMAAINVQPTTSTFAAIKNFRDRTTTVRQIVTDNRALNAAAWIPEPVASAMDDDDVDERCPTEKSACEADAACMNCTMTVDTSCSGAITTCSDMVDEMCCMYGASCSNNTALVALLDCSVDIDGCNIDSDLCDTEDDNGTLDEEVCTTELTACVNDQTCLACMMGDGEDDDCADPDDMDSCDELAESACCSFGDSSACRENDELLAFLNCYGEVVTGSDCGWTDYCSAALSLAGRSPGIAILTAAATGVLFAVFDGLL